jgi:hypothetical protein
MEKPGLIGIIKDTPCEKCGAPSVRVTRDLKEGEPVRGKDGRLWATWEDNGPWHYRCELHPRYPRHEYRPRP